MTKASIGIVGYGFVGKAVHHGFQHQNISIADPLQKTSTADFIGKKFDAIFICVPTPMGKDGSIDSSIVEKVMLELSGVDTLLVLKSTVTPDIVAKLAQYPNFVYNPEFLTERNAKHDFEFPSLHVYGGSKENTKKLNYIYEHYSICVPAPVFHVSAVEASFIKYGINTFLATKVLFWNQFADAVESMGGDYEEITAAISTDPRIGASHISVPGHDGKRGFGGACFTKDTAAFSAFAKNNFTLLDEAIKANNVIRSKYELCDREKEQNVHYV